MVRMRTRGAVAGRGELPGRLDAVHAGHPDVHQHDVGPQLAADADRLGAVGRGADDGEVRLGVEQFGEPGAHHLVVVGDDDTDAGHGAAHRRWLGAGGQAWLR